MRHHQITAIALLLLTFSCNSKCPEEKNGGLIIPNTMSDTIVMREKTQPEGCLNWATNINHIKKTEADLIPSEMDIFPLEDYHCMVKKIVEYEKSRGCSLDSAILMLSDGDLIPADSIKRWWNTFK